VTDPLTRRAITEITDGLAPALKRRGLLRSGFNHKLFRDKPAGVLSRADRGIWQPPIVALARGMLETAMRPATKWTP